MIEATVLYVGMKQLSGTGEAKAKYIMNIILAANTKHQDSVNVQYAYERIRLAEAKRMQNSSVREVEDIRYQ